MKILLSIAFIIWMGTSCSNVSLQPVATLDKMVKEDRVNGEWNGPKGSFRVDPLTKSAFYDNLTRALWHNRTIDMPNDAVSREEKFDSLMADKSYLLSFWQNDVQHYMLLRIVNLGGDLYGDLWPVGVEDKNGSDNYGLTMNHLPTHTLAKIEIKDNATIALSVVAGDYVKAQLLAGNMRLKYEYDELFGTFAVTASSVELQQFITKYGRDQRLFAQPVILHKKS